eukprot:TRINITY_DN3860_c0_g2_i2.p1 TRINITY_DN3860_c0_g2~~TRINITY_DN3860_c0_g2_i2.p1  ORF type:complete len:390 (+),score=81.45 TRINITY_DN3860_c0_g2_i2:86-1255(+)
MAGNFLGQSSTESSVVPIYSSENKERLIKLNGELLQCLNNSSTPEYHKNGHLLSLKRHFDKESADNDLSKNVNLEVKRRKTKRGKLNLTINEVEHNTSLNKANKLEEDCDYLKKIVKEKMKENYLLKTFLRHLEETISSKESLELALENIHQVNSAKSVEVISKILQSKARRDDQEKKKPKSIVIINSSAVDEKKEKELRNTISLLNAKIDRQLREIRNLKGELMRKKYANNSLIALFECCISQQMEINHARTAQSLVTKNTPLPLFNTTDLDSFSASEKEEIVKAFLSNNTVLKRLSEIVLSQFQNRLLNTRIKMPLASSAMGDNKVTIALDKGNESLGGASLKSRGTPLSVQLNTAKIIFQVKSLPRIILKKRILANDANLLKITNS